MDRRIGVISTGACLPDEVRENTWWQQDVVAKWKSKLAKWEPPQFAKVDPTGAPSGTALTIQALRELEHDPFQGSQQRRIMGKEQRVAELEAAAAREAITAANISTDRVGAILSSSLVPDYLCAPSACIVHDMLGLRPDCQALAVDTVCNSFQTQLDLAEQLVHGGRAEYVLLVQSSAASRIAPFERAFTVPFGDGATAVLVGRVSEGRGVTARQHRVVGRLHKSLIIAGPDGAPFWERGPLRAFSADEEGARDVFINLADRAREVVLAALATARLKPEDVDFFACHQATSWMRRVCQEAIGLSRARSLDTHPFAGTLSSSNLPLVLHTASAEGKLRDDDTVVLFSGGTGATWSATVLKWGR